tara:strand:+ start:71 stop:547 length:477 start_codon:yes stop_codon:yes gene_type:complete
MTERELTLDTFDCKCKDCHFVFEEDGFSDFIYGEKFFRSTDGREVAYIDCINDKVFDSVSNTVDALLPKERTSKIKRQAFNNVIGLVCDPINKKMLDATVGIVCPKCGSSSIERYDYEPPKTITRKLPVVTHYHWNSLSEEKQQNIIITKLKEAGYIS